MVPEIERTATMREPAHDGLPRANHLLAVDSKILAGSVGATRDHQAPGDEGRGVSRPTVLDG